jgi:phosphoribosylformylglycinamidine cyclo-ligase
LAKGLAHITGGGLLENIPRILPPGMTARLDARKWRRPPVFNWLQKTGDVPDVEMARTFNCGIGMMVVVAPDKAGEKVFRIGQIVPGPEGAEVNHMDQAWHG